LDLLRGLNLALAFGLELAMLAAFGFAALQITDIFWLRVLLAVIVIAIAVTLWAFFAAPRSTMRLPMPGLLIFKVVLFALGALALLLTGQWLWALVLAALTLISFGLTAAFNQW
jgi:Protein of unknown function (DUF2568)